MFMRYQIILFVATLLGSVFLFTGCSMYTDSSDKVGSDGVKGSKGWWNQRQTEQTKDKHLKGQFSDQF